MAKLAGVIRCHVFAEDEFALVHVSDAKLFTEPKAKDALAKTKKLRLRGFERYRGRSAAAPAPCVCLICA